MHDWNQKSNRLAQYREAQEQCERELALLTQLIREAESEPILNSDGDVVAWIDCVSTQSCRES